MQESGEAELKGAVKCLYIGPGEHGGGDEEAQIVADLITKKVDGIAVSPANAPAMANALQGAAAAKIPVLTWDSDLLPKDKACALAYVGTHNYDIGVNIAKLVMAIKPKGGTICIQSGGAAAANHNERMQGIRDTLSGEKSGEPPGTRLTGQNGWKEADGCPLYTNDDFTRRQPADGGHSQQVSGPRRLYADRRLPAVPAGRLRKDGHEVQGQDRLGRARARCRRHAAGPDRIMKKGLSAGQVGQRPFEMGYKAMYFLKDIKDGKAAARRSDLHWP